MQSFEADKLRTDVNKLFAGIATTKTPDIIVCKRCHQELTKCKCENSCHYADHKVNCECVSLYNLIYNVAKAVSEGKITTRDDGFLA